MSTTTTTARVAYNLLMATMYLCFGLLFVAGMAKLVVG